MHLKCTRWHEEIRVEHLRRFMFTDGKCLRQNEDKTISECFICDQSKNELLVKCIACSKYAHPSCMTDSLTVTVFIDR